MSNLYELTKEIHELLPQVAEKIGKEIDIKHTAENYWYEVYDDLGDVTQREGSVYLYERNDTFKRLCPAIQSDQIRQILVGLSEALEQDKGWQQHKKYYEQMQEDLIKANRLPYSNARIRGLFMIDQTSYSSDLCQHWLDGLDPLFDREPETVLQELVRVFEEFKNNLSY